eukprot:g778.t1
MFGGAGAAPSNDNPNGDVEVPNPPDDGISCLAWSCHNHLAVGSWDRSIRVWDVKMQGVGAQMQVAANPMLQYTMDGPVLCVAFSKDGTILFSGGCDNQIKMRNLQNNQEQIIGKHNAPVKSIFWCEEMKMVISGSWDKTIKFWTGQSQTAAASLDLPERVYSMDLQYPVLVVGCAERKLLVYDLAQIGQNTQPVRTGDTALKMQTRCVAAFPDKTGYAVGSIEGRCSIAYLSMTDKNFAFKCHRYSYFLRLGVFTFWDKDNRQRLKQFSSVNSPITATAFNPSGHLFAYACSYDWSKGHEHNYTNIPRKIFLHRCDEAEIKPKPAGNNQRPGVRR